MEWTIIFIFYSNFDILHHEKVLCSIFGHKYALSYAPHEL